MDFLSRVGGRHVLFGSPDHFRESWTKVVCLEAAMFEVWRSQLAGHGNFLCKTVEGPVGGAYVGFPPLQCFLDYFEE